VDFIQILNDFGLPISMVIAFGFYIWKQTTYIQDELDSNLDKSFARLEGIIIKLISEQKKTQLKVERIKSYVEGIEDILCRLTGLKMKDRNDTRHVK
tara:strand:- start:2097 stop:2387 length:291 start_codon:yes stop_codon:yes gene_type:complete